MSRQILYFTEPNGSSPPREYIHSLDAEERAAIDLKLETMSELLPIDWPKNWTSPVRGDLFRLRQGDHRIFYALKGDNICIPHAVRKRGRRLSNRAIRIALDRLNQMMDS
jgi:phage-related protein